MHNNMKINLSGRKNIPVILIDKCFQIRQCIDHFPIVGTISLLPKVWYHLILVIICML